MRSPILFLIFTSGVVLLRSSFLVSESLDRSLFLSEPTNAITDTAIPLMECYDQRHQTLTMVPADEFWSNPTCSLDFRDRVLVLHPGRGGGGTMEKIQNKFRFASSKCHPSPGYCEKKLPKAEQVVVSIRDPVDRFVSAFHWRSWMLCDKDRAKDSRIRNPKKRVTANPHEFCAEGGNHEEEREILHETYHSNINEFAESLCDNNGPQGDLAREHATKIQHLKSPLTDWLNFVLQSDDEESDHHPNLPSLKQVMAVVLEPKTEVDDESFEETVSNALQHLIQNEYPHAPFNFVAPPFASSSSSRQATMHSSAALSFFPNGTPKTPVSPLGECCIARHLSNDYKILQVLAGTTDDYELDPRLAKACQWGTEENTQQCWNGLKSMIQRREAYLKDRSLSCQQVVEQL